MHSPSHGKSRSLIGLAALFLAILPVVVQGAPRCGSFELVPTPNPGALSNTLVDVAPLADGTAWAAGTRSDGAGSGLILRYDGEDWIDHPLPPGYEDVLISTMGSTPEGDVWMIGTRSATVYQVEVVCLRARGAGIDRSDAFLNGGAPIDVSATAADDVWSVSGGLWPADGGGYVQRFDGSGWQTSSLPAVFLRSNRPQGIYAAGPDDVWVAGYGGDQRGEYTGYVLHWDGFDWEVVPTPFDGQDQTFFTAIDGSAPDDIIISGHANYETPILLRWDGSTWTQQAGPDAGMVMDDVVALAAGNAWATPYSLTPGQPLFYWDGDAWDDGTVLMIPGAESVNWRSLSGGGDCTAWAVGSYHDGTTHRTLAAKLVPGSGGSGTTGVGDPAPRSVKLLGNHPNPFNPSTVIAYSLPTSQAVTLQVLDVQGRVIRKLVDGVQEAGPRRAVWDGRDAVGRPVASGAYVYELRHGNGASSGKMTLTR